jgi:hypothetical protein
MYKSNINNEHLTERLGRIELILLRYLPELRLQEDSIPRDNLMGQYISEKVIQTSIFRHLNTGEKQEPQIHEEKEVLTNIGWSNYVIVRPFYYSPCTMNIPREYQGIDTPDTKESL